LIVTTIFGSALILLKNLLYGRMIGELAASVGLRHISGLFLTLVLVYMFLLLFDGFINGCLGCVGEFARGKIDGMLSGIIFQKAYEKNHRELYRPDYLDMNRFIREHYGEILSSLENLIGIVFGSLAVVLASVPLFIATEPLMLIYLLLIILIRGSTSYYFSKKYYQLMKYTLATQIRREEYYRELMSNKKYGKEIRVYNLLAFLQGKWKTVYDDIWRLRRKRNLKERDYQNAGSIVITLLDYGVILLLLYSAYRGNINLAEFSMLFALSRTCSSQVGNIAESLTKNTYNSAAYIKELREYIEPVTAENLMKNVAKPGYSDGLAFGGFERLKAENLSFTYPQSNKKAVDSVDFELNKGEIVSILGYNGSGKTTLSKLLTGLFSPDGGRVELNGRNISGVPREDVYKYFGFAYQEFISYILPLRQNVGLGRVEHMENTDMLADAYRKGNLEKIISNLPKGDETVLGRTYWTESVELSGGEWQRVILSRAHMGNPEILILDEPTASIDPLEELRMLENLRQYVTGRTAVLISHRIGFARLADRILVMDGGKIKESGSHEELLSRNGLYAALFNSQKNLYN